MKRSRVVIRWLHKVMLPKKFTYTGWNRTVRPRLHGYTNCGLSFVIPLLKPRILMASCERRRTQPLDHAATRSIDLTRT